MYVYIYMYMYIYIYIERERYAIICDYIDLDKPHNNCAVSVRLNHVVVCVFVPSEMLTCGLLK